MTSTVITVDCLTDPLLDFPIPCVDCPDPPVPAVWFVDLHKSCGCGSEHPSCEAHRKDSIGIVKYLNTLPLIRCAECDKPLKMGPVTWRPIKD